MTPQSCKAKGRRLQQKVAAIIQDWFSVLHNSDVRSLPMGSQGADIWLSAAAREAFPFAVECKAVEKLNVWQAFEQAKAHAEKEKLTPLLVFSKNHSEILAVIKFEDLLKLL